MAFRSFLVPFEHGADHTIIGSEPFCTVAVVGPGATLLKGIGYVSLGEVALKKRPVLLQRRAFSAVFQPEDIFFGCLNLHECCQRLDVPLAPFWCREQWLLDCGKMGRCHTSGT